MVVQYALKIRLLTEKISRRTLTKGSFWLRLTVENNSNRLTGLALTTGTSCEELPDETAHTQTSLASCFLYQCHFFFGSLYAKFHHKTTFWGKVIGFAAGHFSERRIPKWLLQRQEVRDSFVKRQCTRSACAGKSKLRLPR